MVPRGIISVAYVCLRVRLYVCLSVCNTIISESFDAESSFLVCGCILYENWVKFVYEGHRVKVNVTGAKGNKSGSIEDRTVKFACSMEFWTMADPMVDRHLCHVTGSDYA